MPHGQHQGHPGDMPYGQQHQQGQLPGKPRRSRGRRLLRAIRNLIIIAIIASIGYFGYRFYQSASNLTGNKNPASLLGSLIGADLKESNGRTNILLAGYSADDPGHGGAELTDSIMILSVDTKNNNAVMVSVPRDLYVEVPGYGYSKINAAYQYGEKAGFSEAGYAAGGMGLLQRTIAQNFGIDFNYYALVNYSAVKAAVDAVDGVTVTIDSSDPDGIYDPYANLRLANGSVTLDGQQALNLTRARGAGYGSYGLATGDFARTANQQMLLKALKGKIASTSTLTNPFKVAELADAVGDNVRTDLSLGELQTLYNKSKSTSDGNITSVTLNDYQGRNLLASYATRSGQSALVPAAGIDDYSQIRAALQTLMAPATASAATGGQ